MSENSPYTPPSAAVADAAVGYGDIRIFSLSGRLGRVRYLTYSFGLMLVGMVLMGIVGAIMGSQMGSTLNMVIMGVIYIAMLVVSVMIAVQRLHDLDKTGWLYLLFLVPIVNIIFGLYVLFAPGTQGANRYGNPPPPNSTGVVIAMWLLIIVFVGGILAAIAIPAYDGYVKKSQEIQLQQQQ